MNKEKLLKRITIDPRILVGKPVIKGTRLSVQYILGLLSNGSTMEEIIKEYKGLTKEDIMACFFFASETLDNNTFLPLTKQGA